METLTQTEIGRRISKLRKGKGYSQDEFARMLEIPRPSFTQIELGNRNISVTELQKIAAILSVSLDRFLAADFDSGQLLSEKEATEDTQDIRISLPELKVEKFSNILLYILEKCAGKPNVGETLLYKLLYFSDFNYYEIYEEHLSGAEYRKLPYGPAPPKFDSIVNQMISEKMLKRLKVDYHGYPQTRYLPLSKPDLLKLKASEKDVIDRVIEQYADWSASAISHYSHKDMPWLATKEGDVIDYELAFYREPPYSVRNYEDSNL